MRRLALILALCAYSPLCWQPLRGEPQGKDKRTNEPKQDSSLTTSKPAANEHGSKESPMFVDILGRQKSADEAAEDQKADDYKRTVDIWTLGIAGLVAIFTGALVIVGWRGVNAANRTLRAIETDLIISHRAYLSLGEIEKPIGDQAILPITNTGHVPTMIISISVQIEAPDETTTYRTWNKQLAPFQDLNPGEIYNVIVSLPDEAGVSDHVLVNGVIEYGSGFKPYIHSPAGLYKNEPTDFFTFRRAYSKRLSQWEIASRSAEIKFVHSEVEDEDSEGQHPI